MILESFHIDTPTLSSLEAFQQTRKLSVDLCEPLRKEDYIPQPVAYISPPKWHLAHTSWFFEEFILVHFLPDYQRFHPDFSYLFNSYYNNIGTRVLRADRGNITRPGVDEVYAYRRYIDKHVEDLLQKNQNEQIEELITLGIHHEQQHQELLITDLKYILGHNPVFPVYHNEFNLISQEISDKGECIIDEGIYEIGFEGGGFCYDNELGRHKVYLHQFAVDTALISNGEYLEFIQDGGYNNFDLWFDEGWNWVKETNATSPLYWHYINGEWQYYTLSGLKKVRKDHILCHINFYEASAFAEWSGKRLLTEFEWEIASDHFKWGKRWEWTISAYLPYPGFQKAPGAIGEYNGKFMVNQKVLRGASSATSPDHSRKTYRNFFHPHLQWQCTGIRLCKS